jgi:hypothetical protein
MKYGKHEVIVKNTCPHSVFLDGQYIGEVYLARPESKNLRYWAVTFGFYRHSGFNTFSEARDAAYYGACEQIED